jgi:hypothetical protein
LSGPRLDTQGTATLHLVSDGQNQSSGSGSVESRMFSGLLDLHPDADPAPHPDPSTNKQKMKKNLDSTVL